LTLNEAFLLVVRWVHLTASVAWVGGSIFYLFVLRPALRRSADTGREVNQYTAAEFKVLVDVCFFIIVVTGISLTFDRLSQGVTGPAYAIVLAIKVVLSIWMFLLASRRRRRTVLTEAHRASTELPTGHLHRVLRAISGYNTIIILGVVVFFLADLLKVMYEMAVR
jgi:uncharacterized membrane protein